VGLGLTLARRIAEGHGGSIEVESAPGEGTIVRVKLPGAGPRERTGPGGEAAPRET
jgi:signal transduction histidine kinase